jgi:hypothetical protein
VVRRLDHDGDGEVSFSDFFNRLLPYFVYSGTGITPANQISKYSPNPLRSKSSRGGLKKNRSMTSIKQATAMKQKAGKSIGGALPQSIFDGRLAALSFEDTASSKKVLRNRAAPHKLSDR